MEDKYINNRMTLQALKSCCKKNMFGIKFAVMKCHHPKEFQELFRYVITDDFFMNINREYIPRTY